MFVWIISTSGILLQTIMNSRLQHQQIDKNANKCRIRTTILPFLLVVSTKVANFTH